MKLFIYIQIKVQTWLQCETFIKHVLTHSESMLMEEQLLLAREREICITVLNRTSSVRSLQYLASLFLCLLIITYERHFRCFIIAFCRLNASDDWKTCYIDCSIVCLCVFVCVCARARARNNIMPDTSTSCQAFMQCSGGYGQFVIPYCKCWFLLH